LSYVIVVTDYDAERASIDANQVPSHDEVPR
jgi:hypothetical protein